MEEVRPIIKVEVGDSEKSVKGLKQEISDLRDKILNLTKGTDEYNEAVEQLQQNQRDLDNVMALTKKNATALEGSYDALTHQMAQLKKEWRATADEAKRADLGKQIDEINNELKEMDASVGNFQRNVGNYVSHWEGMPEVTKDFGTAMREMNESIEPTKQKFEAVGKISSGLASGFAVVQGSMALLGIESENLEKTFVKLQAAMAIMQGVKGIGDLVEGLGKAKVAFSDTNKAAAATAKTLGKGGWIAIILAVVAAIASLVIYLQKTKKGISETDKAMKDLNKSMIENMSSITDSVTELKVYEKIATDSSAADDKRQRAAKKVLEALNEMPTATNIAAVMEGKYKQKIDDTTTALINEAKAQIALDKIKAKAAEIEAQKEKNLEKAQKKRDKADKNEQNGPNFWDYVLTAGENLSGGGNHMTPKQRNDRQVADLRAEADRLVESNKKLDEEMKEYTNAIIKQVDITKSNGNGGGGSVAEVTIEQLKNTQKTLTQTTQESLSNLDSAYNRMIAYAKMGAKTESDAAKQSYDLTVKKETQKLEIIKTALESSQALTKTNKEKIEDLEKKKADKEAEIAKTTNKTKKAAKQKELNTIIKSLNEAYTAEEENVKLTNDLIEQQANTELAIKQAMFDEEKRLSNESYQNHRNNIIGLTVDYQNAKRELAISSPSSQEPKKRNVGALFGLGELDSQKAEKAQREIDNEYYKQAFEAEQTFLAEKLRLNQEFLANTTDADQKIELERIITDTQLQIDEGMYAEKERLRQLDLQKEQEKQQKTQAIFNASLQATSALLNGIADAYESSNKREQESDEEKKKSAQKVKNLRIAAATIDMFQGATTAFATAMQLGPIAGPIVGGINAAAVIASGIANINKIKQTNADGGAVSGGNGAATPSAGSYTSDIPFSYTRQVTGASEVDALNQDTRVVILESDIQESLKRVEVRQNESTF